MTLAATAPEHLKACCAELWSHPGVRIVVGDHLHPGGRALTERALDLVAAAPGDRLVDLGCGPGATAAVAAARGHRVVALDRSVAAVVEARSASGGGALAADGERLPLRSGSVDGAVAECVISALPDKEAAVREVARVLRPGGSFVMADVAREGPLPEELDTFVAWLACAGGALSFDGYADLLERAGLEVMLVEGHPSALLDLVDQVRRRLALFQAAVSTAIVDPTSLGLPAAVVDAGQRLLGLAREAAADGALSYGVIAARS